MFRSAFRSFVERELAPDYAQWEQAGIVPRQIWQAMGRQGFLGMQVPEELGGAGVDDFRYNVIVAEELARIGANDLGVGFGVHTDIVIPYILRYGSAEQQQRWLPGMVSGDRIGAIGMTEPATGSDLAGIRTTALRDGDDYVLNGQKTFISNGINSDLVIVVAKTDMTQGHKGISLLVVERGMPGFERGRKLEKLGLHAQDTAELFFADVRVPAANLLGEAGQGFTYLMTQLPQERLTIAIDAVAAAETALEWTVGYCQEREAFGQPIGKFQHNRFCLAEMQTEITIGRVFVDRCILELNAGTLTTAEASMAKWWTTDLYKRVVDQCLQLHGGYGYMLEYPIARAYRNARAAGIYGGTNEIMKEIIGRAMGF
jgi:long-chain-acyl-CoA dehydrogenase